MTRMDRIRSGRESGFVAIWFAMMAVVLFGLAAFAVDTARWYVEAERLQKSVDAAALAGVTYMPGSLADANANGKLIAEANFLPVDGTSVTYAGQVGDRPSRYQVTMSHEFTNAFAGVMGIPTTRITRTAVADFAGPVPMGSPCNVMGRDDMETGGNRWSSPTECAGVGTYWVNMAGKNTNKARGDGYASGWCTLPDAAVIDKCVDNRWSGNTTTNPGINADYDPNGYVFIARTKTTGTLDLQGYDIGWAATGDHCNEFNLMSGSRPNNQYVSAAEATTRYAIGDSSFCTGDTSMDSPNGDRSTVQTKVTIRQPSPNPFNPLGGATACEFTLPGWGESTPKSALQGTTGGDELLKRTFHRWTSLCPAHSLSVTSANLGDWSVQVQTLGGGGQNRFALRAKVGGSSDQVSIFAAGKVSLFNNVPSGTSYFKVARLDSSTAAHVFIVRFFDMGDASDVVTASVLKPDGGPTDYFANCVGTGPVNGTLTNCSVSTTAATNGGRWQEIAIPIPSTYHCSNDASQSACWVRVKLTTGNTQSDTTTWSAALAGDPVRIVPAAP